MSDLLAPLERHQAGTNRVVRVAADVTGRAVFGDPLDCYRYLLERAWDRNKWTALVVMMNPSAADPHVDDRTVAKVTRMVRRWSWNGVPNAFGRLLVGNTFAYRATDQHRLLEVDDPIGPDNDRWLRTMAFEAAVTVFAYGSPKTLMLQERGPAVVRMLKEGGVKPYALRVTNGRPHHPLYLPDSTEPVAWAC